MRDLEQLENLRHSLEFKRLFKETLHELLQPVAELELLRHKEYLSEAEACKLFSLAPSTLRTKRSRGIGPGYIKDGTRVLYSNKKLREYMAARIIKTGF